MIIRRKRRDVRVAFTLGLYIVVFGGTSLWTSFVGSSDFDQSSLIDTDEHLSGPGRQLLQEEESWKNCTPRSIEQFPPDFLTPEQRKQGGVVIHILISIYIFAALAIICDDYFVSSLEKICTVLDLQPDVAGATFMAAGSSAPELFTSIVGLFFAKSDVGVGTIVGSAVFNILFIIAICGLFAGMVIYLTWWPMFRDCVFYMASVIALVVVIYDEQIHWYEATVMLVMYALYIMIMFFNPRLGSYIIAKVDKWKQGRKKTNDENTKEKQPLLVGSSPDEKTSEEKKDIDYESMGSLKNETQENSGSNKNGDEINLSTDFESPWTVPETTIKRIQWAVMLPATALFFITVPDCRRPGIWQKLYAVTFINSIIWIAGMAYVMVWMVTIAGDTLSIPDTVMGLTLLAAGTSVPDALASLFVARDGYGDMAVSNSIGSNVFDILICLGLPWFIQTVIVDTNGIVHMSSASLTFSAITLLGTVFFLFIAMFINKWRLNRKLGVACLVLYVIVITFCCLYELNIFVPVNPPPCPRSPGY